MRSQIKRLTSIIPLLSVLVFAAPFARAQGVIRTIAGGGRQTNTPAVSADLPEPWSVAVDGSGNLYIVASSLTKAFKFKC